MRKVHCFMLAYVSVLYSLRWCFGSPILIAEKVAGKALLAVGGLDSGYGWGPWPIMQRD